MIGAGASASVSKVQWKGITVAVKKFHIIEGNFSPADFDQMVADFRIESNVYCFCEHRNIIKIHGISTTLPNLCLVMEYMEHHSLRLLRNL